MGRFTNFDRCRAQVASDFISGVAVGYVRMDVLVKLDDSRLSSGRIIRLFAGRTRFMHFCAAFNFLFAAGRKQLIISYVADL